jgi:MerR family mercuric resistance operon transcriptional regulator
MKKSRLTIGALARRAGVGVETVRYYQRRKLLATPDRGARGIRYYEDDAVRRLRFIKRAQALGFNLKEVAELLRLNDGKHCAATRTLALRKRGELDDRIQELVAIRGALDQLIDACAGNERALTCPIIAAFASE